MFQKFTVSTIFLMLLCSQISFGQDDAIKKVIIAEADAFNMRDSAAWQSNWASDPTASLTFLMPNRTMSWTGWEKISKVGFDYMRKNPAPDSSMVTRDSFVVRKDANLATVDFKETIKVKRFDSVETRLSSEHRVLTKVKGKWKIISMTSDATQMYGNSPAAIENSLNNTGYALMGDKKMEDALKVFKLNVELFPNAWNTYDSLGECYLMMGNKEMAKSNYEKSIQLNPKNENGKKALEEL